MLFRNLIIDDTNPPPSPELVAELEDELGCKLPADYRHFLDACNGGHAQYEVNVKFDDGTSEALSFNSFYSVAPGSWGTLPFELDNVRDQPGFPDQKVLPIACDGGSSVLFLDLRKECRVVAFVHGLPAWTGLRQKDTLVTVAPTFNDYLDALYISDDAIVDAITHFDPKYNVPEMMAEWFDTRSPNWRTKHAEIWNRHVLHCGGGTHS
jgi:hypothetical protein